MEVQNAGEVISPSSMTLTSGAILGNTEFVFSSEGDVLTHADGRVEDGTATFITVPFQFLQNDGVSDLTGPPPPPPPAPPQSLATPQSTQNILLKTSNGNTLLLDASQFALLTGGTSQLIINDSEFTEEGQVLLTEDVISKDKILPKTQILSEMGIGIETIDLNNLSTTDVLSVDIDEVPDISVGEATDAHITFNLEDPGCPPEPTKCHVPEEKPKRGPGRPRRDESEIEPPIGKGPYPCEVCGKEFVKWSQMKKHVKLHSDDKPFLCNQCTASFNVESNLKLHMVTHDPDNPVCPECNRRFSRLASLKAHIMLHEKEESLFCSECGDEFSTQGQLDAHQKEHTQEWTKPPSKAHQCRQCHQMFSRGSVLREHMKDHYKVKASLSHKSHKRNIDRSTFIHKCDTCAKCFQKPSQLVRHRRIHTGERPYKCNLCSKAFNQKGSLQIHMSKHNGFKPFQCDFCAAAFSQKGNLRAHILRVHTIPHSGEQVYKCTECTCLFKKLGSLNAHMSRMHYTSDSQKAGSEGNAPKDVESDSQGLHTEKCSQGDSDILQQALVNSGLSEKDTQTSVFGKDLADVIQKQCKDLEAYNESQAAGSASESNADTSAVSSAAGTGRAQRAVRTSVVTLADKGLDGTVRRYNIRQRRIGNIRWHQCPYCTKEFKKPSDLVRHIRTHTHERPYKCSHCFRSFAVKSTLTAHVRTHTGVKDYVCYTCGKKFASASSLKVHIRLHTGNKPFSCPHCGKAFRTAGQRRMHVLLHLRDSVDGDAGDGRRRRRASKADLGSLPPVTLQQPIIITENGLVQSAVAHNSLVFLPGDTVSMDRPHKCGVCNAAFRKVSHLKQHQRLHTGERPFKCSQCNKCFISNGILRAHLRVHQGLKMFKCNVCNNMFTTKGSLKRHEATHNESKPFMCPYCHKTFKTSLNCRKHMKIHQHELALQAVQQGKAVEAVASALPQAVELSGASFAAGSLAPDYAQAFADQTFTIGTAAGQDQVESEFAQTTLVQTLTAGDLADSNLAAGQGVITHTLHADASGTITLPTLPGQHSLTQNISELERTLNEQLFGASGAGTLVDSSCQAGTLPLEGAGGEGEEDSGDEEEEDSGEEAGGEEDATATADLAHTQPGHSSLIGELVLCDSDVADKSGKTHADSMFEASFGAQPFDNCVFSSITLQNDSLSLDPLAQGPAITTSMASILPPAGSNTPTEEVALPGVDAGEGMPEAAAMGLAADSLDSNGSEAADTDLFEDEDSSEQPLQRRRRSHHRANAGLRPYKCKMCNRSFKKISHLKAHIRSHTGEKLFACAMCEQRCVTRNALKAHMKLHTGEKDFVCHVCNCRFATNGSLVRHMIVHSDKRPFKCSMCDGHFRTPAQLRRHIRLHEPREKKGEVVAHEVVSDAEVNSGLRSRRRAAVIQLSAEETRVLAQQDIESATTVSEKVLISSAAEKDRISELRDPEEQYRDEPLFANQCKYCPKSFRKPSDLVRHIRIHTGERPFQCSCCNKCFTVKSTLDSHVKTHSGQKLCTCHVCGRLFATKGSLKVHMRLHTGARPFKCPMCDLRFRTSGHRKAHLISHMKETTSSRGGSGHRVLKKRRAASTSATRPVSASTLAPASREEQTLPAEPVAQITLDAAALGNLLPLTSSSDMLNPGTLLTTSADGTVVNSMQLQLGDGFQITGVDASGNLLATQSLQLDESIVQHLQQASNIIIQTSLPSIIPDSVDDTLADASEETQAVEGGDMAVRYEIHTDEHGQIINIQPVTSGVSSSNIIFNVGDLGMQVMDNPDDPLEVCEDTLRFRVVENLKGGRSLIAVDKKEAVSDAERSVDMDEDDFLVFHDCKTCGKRFSKPSQLERHNRIHTGERPFQCELCPKRFNQKNALNTHLKSHTGERPFACPHCDYSFTQKGNLKTHLKRAHRFSSIDLPKSVGGPVRSVLKVKQHTTAGGSIKLDTVVCDFFPQVQPPLGD